MILCLFEYSDMISHAPGKCNRSGEQRRTNMKKTKMTRKIISFILSFILATAAFLAVFPDSVYAWKTKTHGYSSNLLLNEIEDGYVTIDGTDYAVPAEFLTALEEYPEAFRAGTLGPDFYPDMLTGQSYIHPYDAKAGVGVGDWLKELVNTVNSLPKEHRARKEALAFTLGMAVHYAGDMFGHDFINAFAGGAYPAYADALTDTNKLFFIIRHMAEETYMDSLIGDRLGSTASEAPVDFLLSTWIYDGNANNGPAEIYSKYEDGMMYQYKYLVELRAKLYKFAEDNRDSITPPVTLMVQYVDEWIADLDTATYQLVVTFDKIAHDFLTGVEDKTDVGIVTDRLNAWLKDYGTYASPAPDILTDMSKAIDKSTAWIMDKLGLSYLTEAWEAFKKELLTDMILWGLAQAGVNYKDYEDLLSNPEAALKANGGSEEDYLEFKSYMDQFAADSEGLEAFYNTLVMGKLILMGPTNLNAFFEKYGVSANYSETTGSVVMDGVDITIHTRDKTFAGTDDNVYVDIYEGDEKVCTRLLDKSGHNDFEQNLWDTYSITLPRDISPDKFWLDIRLEPNSSAELATDDWSIDHVSVACKYGSNFLFEKLTTNEDGDLVWDTGDILVYDGPLVFDEWGKEGRKQKVDPKISSSSLSYATELNLKIIDFMKSNDNSTQWVNSDNTLWSDMTARTNILYEVFKGFKPRIVAVSDADTFYAGDGVCLRAKFYTYWNGISKERRDREDLVESVGEITPEACTGTARLIDVTNGTDTEIDTVEISNGEAVFSLDQLMAGKHKLRVDYDGDSYNGSAKSNVVEVTRETNSVVIILREVTFRVENGAWDDGSTKDVRLVCSPNGLTASDIPAVGNMPNEDYTAGSWDVTPVPKVYLSGNVTYTYTYAPIPDYTVTYRVVNGTWADGTAKLLTEDVKSGSSPASVPEGMTASEGYTGGKWDTDPASSTITGPASFIYSFDPIPIYTVTYKVVNGTWADGSSSDKTEEVSSGSSPASVPEGMTASEGYTGGKWDTDPASSTITGPASFTYTFEKIPTRTVTFDANGHGSAPDVQTVEDGKTVSLPSDPSESGWIFGGWYTEKACSNAFDFSTPVTADITLYAKWNKAGEAVYTVVGGGDSTWTKGSSSGITITVKRSEADDTCFSHFTGVQIDGTALASDDYEAKAGSTIVTLNASALEKLSAGSHTVTVSFDDGKAETSLTVKAAASQTDPNSPKTSDSNHIGLWIVLMIISAIWLGTAVLIRKKKRYTSKH